MVEIKISEKENHNEYFIEAPQTCLGARYDNLSDEIKFTFPQKEIDNESVCFMILTSNTGQVDVVQVYNDKIFKLESPMSQYKQVAISFSFQKLDGYIKNSNIKLFYFCEAHNPDSMIDVDPVQRQKINLVLANGLIYVGWKDGANNILQFKNVDGNVVNEIELPTMVDIENLAKEIDTKQNKVDSSLQTTTKLITGAINEVNSIAKGANQAVSYGNYSTMITALNALENNIYNVGQNIMIVTLEVPDLWVLSIEETSIPYIYVDDKTFTSELSQNGYVQVGYYKLSALETEKVDLTNVAKTNEINEFGEEQHFNNGIVENSGTVLINRNNNNATFRLAPTGELVVSGTNGVRLRPTATLSNVGGIAIKKTYMAPEMSNISLGTNADPFSLLYLGGTVFLNGVDIRGMFGMKIKLSLDENEKSITAELLNYFGQVISSDSISLNNIIV